MGIKLQGGNNSTNLASINALHQLQVVTTQDSAGLSAGFVQMSGEGDAGSVLGNRTVIPFEASDDFRLRVGMDQSVFNSSFEGLNTNTFLWSVNNTTFTSTQAQGFLTQNSGSSVASGGVSYARTWRTFSSFGTYPVYVDMWIREGGHNATNAISEFGLLFITTPITQQPVDGIYFRRISGGKLKAIITNNSLDLVESEINTTNVPSRTGVGVYDPAETNHYTITFHADVVRFWINDVAVAEIKCPSQLAIFAASSSLPVGLRVTNLAGTSVARVLSIGYVNVEYGDQNVCKPWSHAINGMGGGSYQTQLGTTPAPTVTRGAGALGHPTSGTARIAGTWISQSNPGLSNLGGLWTSSVLSGLASDADYPIFSYLNPAGSVSGIATVPGKNLYVTNVRIGDTSITTAPGSTGAFFSYIVQVDSSASTTNTADAATTTSGKSIVIGGQGFAPNDPIGTMKPGFDMTFNPPLVVSPNKYFTVIVRPFSTITSGTLIVTGSVAVNGYFE
jgi:hypothetical protein